MLIERYRTLYAHEKDSDTKLLAMLDSVPESRRDDPRFQQAVNLAAHLCACHENWLDRMTAGGARQVAWFEERAAPGSLRPRFAAVEAAWTDYLAALDDDAVGADFAFPRGDGRPFTLRVEIQILQLVGHGNYHRGQIALLVDQLGGESVDTDYLYWALTPDGG